MVEHDWDEEMVGVKQMTEQFEAIVFTLHDDEDAEELKGCEVIVLEGSLSGSLGFSGLLGVLGSLGLLPAPTQ